MTQLFGLANIIKQQNIV